MCLDPSEVVAELHWDLAEWLGSDAPPKVFDRISAVLDEGFTSVVTTGQLVDRETLLSGLWSARNAQPGLRIEVSEVGEIARRPGLVVVRFIAGNTVGEMTTRRWVTAVLVTDGQRHMWRSVHETPIDVP
ncbi:hypothetical protein [Nocardia otitidiscaviarum]|uniref:hypothetical protein n=1 Tax=Nocardia otitidiscaviarum TaxID=1823 RepID=UPI0005843678|nr:hypothetical protein [Nocardia otitidiscaviarum]